MSFPAITGWVGRIFGRLTDGHEDHGKPPTEAKIKQVHSSAVSVIQSNESRPSNRGEVLGYTEITGWQRQRSTNVDFGGWSERG